jgi:hypothetical protein
MTVTANSRREQYEATAGQTVFPYPFPIQHQDEITVIQTLASDGTSTTLTITTDYTVSDVGEASGGNITLVSGAALDDIITVVGATPTTRTTDFNQAGDFLTSELNDQLDRITHILQENETETKRAFLLKDEDTATSVELPITSVRSSKYLAFDSSGDPIAADGTAESPTTAFMKTVLEAETAAAARTTLDAQEDVITTRGDLIRGSSSAAAERLALGTANQILTSDGTDASWSSDINVTDATISGTLNAPQATQTISSGAITYNRMVINIRGEGNLDDTLTTINGGTSGDILILNKGGTEDITLDSGAGNIVLRNGNDRLLTEGGDKITLYYDGANWTPIAIESSRDFQSSSATNGYTYLPNGDIFQWGTQTVAANTTATITLPVAYSTANLNLVVTYNSTNTALADACAGSRISLTEIGLTNGVSNSASLSYKSIGK